MASLRAVRSRWLRSSGLGESRLRMRIVSFAASFRPITLPEKEYSNRPSMFCINGEMGRALSPCLASHEGSGRSSVLQLKTRFSHFVSGMTLLLRGDTWAILPRTDETGSLRRLQQNAQRPFCSFKKTWFICSEQRALRSWKLAVGVDAKYFLTHSGATPFSTVFTGLFWPLRELE
jgi:hypothetical protein